MPRTGIQSTKTGTHGRIVKAVVFTTVEAVVEIPTAIVVVVR
jgi:hypothetical protein